MGVSQADAQAPAEVHSKKRGREGILRSVDEVNRDERKRLRGAKKAARRKERRSDEAEAKFAARVNPGLGNPYEKRKLMESLRGSRNVISGAAVKLEPEHKSHTSSAKFFEVLANEQKAQKQKPSRK